MSARAIATLTKPGRDADRQRREQDETDSAQRFRERGAARKLWTKAAPIAGTPGEAYLPPGAGLRLHANAPLWDPPEEPKRPDHSFRPGADRGHRRP
ncbi:hypothetical protein [Methylocella tundrae]|uniref:hypothetical protein n=1 Tax=Methylocella tundrae TaxID=227605 RepID=UPI00157A7281|nr:hypothetical protein [Methylocella tundrae]